MDDLISDFIAETREMLAALGGEIVAWEAEPGDRGRLDAIFRFVHTVKGNSGFFDLPRIKALSHAAEDALAAVRAGERTPDARLVGGTLSIIDRLAELVEALESGAPVPSEDDEALIHALSADEEAEQPVPAVAPATRMPARSVRLPVELLDRMMSGVSDLVLARNELARRLRETGACTEVQACFERVSATVADLRDSVTRTRMQRIEGLFAPLPRLVRDLAAETGKKVALTLEGGDVELDREMIEMIRDPLTHIVRNAIDHGLEPLENRRRAGKPEAGRLCVSARQAGNQISIEISDDGRGIDGDALVAKALSEGRLTRERADRLDPRQRVALIFEAGLSTARTVTDLSGRGVGMDVVRANVERIGGVVDVDSRPGEGVRFALKVPLTLSIIPALTVGAGGQCFAIPRASIEEIVRPGAGGVRIESLAGSRIATVRGRRLPILSLARLIGRDPSDTDERLIVLKPAGGGFFALSVDAVHDHEELVVKPAAPAVIGAGLYAGTTIADDGRPVLLLDPPGLAACAGLALDGPEMASEAPAADVDAAPEAAPCLLFRALDGTRRLVEVAAVERIEDVPQADIGATGGRLHVVVGDAILPLEGCGDEVPEGGLRILRLTDGEREIAYGLAEVLDIIRPAGPLLPVTAPGEARGVTLHEGSQIELLDLHWLFARHVLGTPRDTRLPLCVLPEGDPFMETILRPLVESAGYRIGKASDAESADLVILSADEEPPAGTPAIKLRSGPEPRSRKDDSIHRYDRAGLLAALAARRKA